MKLYRKNEPMDRHTTFQTGGPADIFAEPGTEEEIRGLIAEASGNGTPYVVIGHGSNLLVSDSGIRGLVICLGSGFSAVRIDGTMIEAEAGALLSQIAAAALKAGLAGMEFASGIPGSLGGAVIMNAGAYGGEMKDVLTEVRVLEKDGSARWIPAEALELGYRTSNAERNGQIVLGARLCLAEGDPDAIAGKMRDLNGRRKEKQPLEYPSAGSTFKRPEGYFAGKLIEDAGLKGFRVGGAQVSEKHAGFVINRDHAVSGDIARLIREVQERVYENAGVRLETEVRFLGEFE